MGKIIMANTSGKTSLFAILIVFFASCAVLDSFSFGLTEQKAKPQSRKGASDLDPNAADAQFQQLVQKMNSESKSYRYYRSEVEALVRKFPSYAPALGVLAVIRYLEGDFEACLRIADKAIALDESELNAHYARSLVRMKQGDYSGYLKSSEYFLKANDAEKEQLLLILLARGRAYLYLDRPEEAVKCFRSANRLCPNHPDAKFWMWPAYYYLGQYDLAKQPINGELRVKGIHQVDETKDPILAFTNMVCGNVDDALGIAGSYLYMAAPGGRNDPYGNWLLGTVMLFAGNYSSARKHFDIGMHYCKDNDVRHLLEGHRGPRLGMCYLLATCPDAKCRDGKRAIALAIDLCSETKYRHPRYLMLLAMARAECSDYDKALEFSQKAVAATRPDFHMKKQYAEIVKLFKDKRPYRHKAKSLDFDFFLE
jgi:tetratricopeptide (TPR) repeat protein